MPMRMPPGLEMIADPDALKPCFLSLDSEIEELAWAKLLC